MPTSVKRYPPTPEQRTQLALDVQEIEGRLQQVLVLMRACYGAESPVAIRADEMAGALQRFKWELERLEPKTRTAGG